MLVEVVGSMLSILCVWSSGSLSKYTWILSFCASAINGILYVHVRRYGHALLDLFYMICCLAGYSLWSQPTRKVYLATLMEKALIVVCIFVSAMIGSLLLSQLGSQDTFIDSLSLASGIIGIGLLAFKIIDQWWIWVVHDVFNIVLSMRAGLYIIAAKQCVYIVLALMGYWIWRKEIFSS